MNTNNFKHFTTKVLVKYTDHGVDMINNFIALNYKIFDKGKPVGSFFIMWTFKKLKSDPQGEKLKWYICDVVANDEKSLTHDLVKTVRNRAKNCYAISPSPIISIVMLIEASDKALAAPKK